MSVYIIILFIILVWIINKSISSIKIIIEYYIVPKIMIQKLRFEKSVKINAKPYEVYENLGNESLDEPRVAINYVKRGNQYVYELISPELINSVSLLDQIHFEKIIDTNGAVSKIFSVESTFEYELLKQNINFDFIQRDFNDSYFNSKYIKMAEEITDMYISEIAPEEVININFLMQNIFMEIMLKILIDFDEDFYDKNFKYVNSKKLVGQRNIFEIFPSLINDALGVKNQLISKLFPELDRLQLIDFNSLQNTNFGEFHKFIIKLGTQSSDRNSYYHHLASNFKLSLRHTVCLITLILYEGTLNMSEVATSCLYLLNSNKIQSNCISSTPIENSEIGNIRRIVKQLSANLKTSYRLLNDITVDQIVIPKGSIITSTKFIESPNLLSPTNSPQRTAKSGTKYRHNQVSSKSLLNVITQIVVSRFRKGITYDPHKYVKTQEFIGGEQNEPVKIIIAKILKNVAYL